MIPPAIKKLITHAKRKKATDIHICVGAPILFRVGRDLIPASEGKLTADITERMATDLLGEDEMSRFREHMDADLIIADEEDRHRVNVSLDNGTVGIVIRILPELPRTLDDLRVPSVVKHLSTFNKGLILITGSTSQGKSATMSGIINEINHRDRRHIITIEDPVETVHPNVQSIVRQREIGRDTEDFHSGLRAALRQDPDVVAIGEMRDYETIRIGLTAAETGILVLSTLHIISIDKLMERLLSYAPQEDATHFRFLLAGALQAVIHQELLPSVDGGKRVACEVLVVTDAARNIIRHRDSFMLRNTIQTGQRHGMISMRQSIQSLIDEGAVVEDAAQSILQNY
jgi:twitching motility protein PilT